MKKEPKVRDSFTAKNGFTIEYAPDNSADKSMTDAELSKAKFVNAVDVLPAAFFEAAEELQQVKRMGRPPATDPKEATNIRYNKRLLAAFRATGKGWQTRMNDALMEWAIQHGILHK